MARRTRRAGNESRMILSLAILSETRHAGPGRARRSLAAPVPPQEIIWFKFRQPRPGIAGRGF